jgi:hypothetical protein
MYAYLTDGTGHGGRAAPALPLLTTTKMQPLQSGDSASSLPSSVASENSLELHSVATALEEQFMEIKQLAFDFSTPLDSFRSLVLRIFDNGLQSAQVCCVQAL